MTGAAARWFGVIFSLFFILLLFYLPHEQRKRQPPPGPPPFVWPVGQARDARTLIRPDITTTILRPASVCNTNINSSTAAVLLVVVCSAVDNFEAREAIRKSWARDSETKNEAKVVFLLGRPFNDTATMREISVDKFVNHTRQEEVEEESLMYGDIIQEDFIDSYANLTVKSLMLLKWFSQNCNSESRRIQYLLKTDDDMFVNIKNLVKVLRVNKKRYILMGSLICNAAPIRDPFNKWYAPNYMFGDKRYPNYLSGTGYLMDSFAAMKLLNCSFDVPIFHLEDVFITGILSRKAKIRPVDYLGFSYGKRNFEPCLLSQVITTHRVKPQEMIEIENKLMSFDFSQCRPISKKVLRQYSPGRCKWPRW